MKKKIVSALSGLALIISMNTGCATTRHQQINRKVNGSFEYCIDKKYDPDKRCLEDDIETAFQSVYPLKVDIILMVKGEEVIIDSGSGTGLLLEGGYLLTAYHVGRPNQPEKLPKKPIKLFSRLYLQGPEGREYLLTEVASDRKADLFLAKAPANMPNFPAYQHKIGNSDELKIGDMTYLIGNALDGGINMREGAISQLNGETLTGHRGFGISNPGNLGDSGGPVIALRDGKIELVGILINLAEEGDNLSYAVGINDAVDKLKLKELLIKK